MTSSISSNALSAQSYMDKMYQKLMDTTSTDGTAGLTKDELSSLGNNSNNIDGTPIGGPTFFKALSQEFDSLDKNKDGKLTADEIPTATLNKVTDPSSEMATKSCTSTSCSAEDIMKTLFDSQSGNNKNLSSSDAKYKEIASKYDLTNITGSQLQELGNELYSSGLISQDEKNTLQTASNCPLETIDVKQGANGPTVNLSELLDNKASRSENYTQLWSEVKTNASQDSSIEGNAQKVCELFDKINYYKNL